MACNCWVGFFEFLGTTEFTTSSWQEGDQGPHFTVTDVAMHACIDNHAPFNPSRHIKQSKTYDLTLDTNLKCGRVVLSVHKQREPIAGLLAVNYIIGNCSYLADVCKEANYIDVNSLALQKVGIDLEADSRIIASAYIRVVSPTAAKGVE